MVLVFEDQVHVTQFVLAKTVNEVFLENCFSIKFIIEMIKYELKKFKF